MTKMTNIEELNEFQKLEFCKNLMRQICYYYKITYEKNRNILNDHSIFDNKTYTVSTLTSIRTIADEMIRDIELEYLDDEDSCYAGYGYYHDYGDDDDDD